MRLLAAGEYEAAEQQKLAIIQRAEGEREAVISVAQGQVEAIRLVNEADQKIFHLTVTTEDKHGLTIDFFPQEPGLAHAKDHSTLRACKSTGPDDFSKEYNMIETQTAQAKMDESSRCRERSWLSMEDEQRFGVKNPIVVGKNSGELINNELNASNAPFDRLIHIGQNVYLPGDQFVGLITKVFIDANGHASHLAIRTARILGQHKIVPIKSVREATRLRVQLSINHEQFKELSKYQADSTIAEDVDRALWNDVVLRNTDYFQIDVRVQDGVVILNGHVTTSMNQWRAETAVKNIPGILGMKSFLIPDDKLTLKVSGALGQIEQAENSKFFTKVDNGVVVLVGEARSTSIRDQAEQCVAAIPWVRGVINEIRITGMVSELGDQRFLQPLIGKELIFKDGLSATTRSVVIDPRNRRVVSVVLLGQFPNPPQQKPNSAYPEKLVVLPVRLILHLTRSGGFLQIDSTEMSQYQDFEPSRFITPSRDWLPPYPYCTDEVLFLAE